MAEWDYRKDAAWRPGCIFIGADDRGLLDCTYHAKQYAAPSCRAATFYLHYSFYSFLGLVQWVFKKFLCSVRWLQHFVLGWQYFSKAASYWNFMQLRRICKCSVVFLNKQGNVTFCHGLIPARINYCTAPCWLSISAGMEGRIRKSMACGLS